MNIPNGSQSLDLNQRKENQLVSKRKGRRKTGVSGNSQLEGIKQKCEISTFQNGRVPNGKKSPKKGGLDGQAGLEGSIHMFAGVKIAPKISALSTWSKDVLPFGLGSGPRIFPEVMKPFVALLRRIGIRIIIYLEDILILNQSKHGLVKDQNTLMWTLHCLGWIINWSKSVTEPSQTIEILGMIIVSMQGDKSLSSRGEMQSNSPEMQTYARIPPSLYSRSSQSDIGTLNATAEVVIPASLYVRELQMFKTKSLLKTTQYRSLIALTPECKNEMKWWAHTLSGTGNA
ncbi:unnamed protein product [Mytilus coruscus]|uniref:Reverse transcriptase domain-containing protein n=1 Tax=Mytilus coruscus TaxID=42192 RepID=A0A6J8E9E8_MYTCO|nr:unnamed protein product [Mytilus coruscus]